MTGWGVSEDGLAHHLFKYYIEVIITIKDFFCLAIIAVKTCTKDGYFELPNIIYL